MVNLLAACQLSANDTTSRSAQSKVVTSLYQPELTAEQLRHQCQQNIAADERTFTELEQLAPPYSIATVLEPVDQLFLSIDNNSSMVYLLSNVHADLALQAAADNCLQDFSKLLTNIALSKEIYLRLSQINYSSADKDSQRYLKKLIHNFKRSGVDMSEAERNYIRKLNDNITQLGQQFSKNIRDDVRYIQLQSADQLSGLPEDYIEQHQPDGGGNITVSTDYPDIFPFLRYADDDAARLSIYKLFLNRGYPTNDQVLKKIVSQRHQLAITLGYPDYASYVTENLMVKNSQVIS
ncbi:MAG: thimet oligopeptidase, partial [Oceanicoccus sp.]